MSNRGDAIGSGLPPGRESFLFSSCQYKIVGRITTLSLVFMKEGIGSNIHANVRALAIYRLAPNLGLIRGKNDACIVASNLLVGE